MHHNQNTKIVVAQLGTQATNATAASDLIDTLGYHNCTIVVASPKATATNGTQRWDSLVVQEADDTNTSSFSAITGLTWTTTTGQTLTLPSNNSTSTFGSIQMNISLTNGRKRYLRVVSQPPSTNYHTNTVIASLGRAEQAPTNATQAGVLARVTA